MCSLVPCVIGQTSGVLTHAWHLMICLRIALMLGTQESSLTMSLNTLPFNLTVDVMLLLEVALIAKSWFGDSEGGGGGEEGDGSTAWSFLSVHPLMCMSHDVCMCMSHDVGHREVLSYSISRSCSEESNVYWCLASIVSVLKQL